MKNKLILIVCLAVLVKTGILCADETRDTYFNRGIEYANKGMNLQAIDAFKKCIQVDSRFVDVYYSLGVVYINERKYDEAVEALKKAVQLNPQRSLAYYLLGKVYEKKRLFNEAVNVWRTFISLEPNSERSREIKERLVVYEGK